MDQRNDVDLRGAIPETPAMCRDAVLQAVSTYQDERATRRPSKMLIAIVAALVLMSGTIALAASGWNVLAFLGLTNEPEIAEHVAPVSDAAKNQNCMIRIDSAITDGYAFAFDWTVENLDPTSPFYIQVERITGNGIPIDLDGNDDFNCQWFPGAYNSGMMEGGNLASIPDSISEDTLKVEMVIGIYRPTKPVYMMQGFSPDIIKEKQDEGYYVIVDGEGLVVNHPEEGILVGYGAVNDTTGKDLKRSVMIIQFELDLTAGREATKVLQLPEPRVADGITMYYRTAYVTPLKVELSILLSGDSMDYDEACRLLEQGFFTITDKNGSQFDLIILDSMGGVTQLDDGSWCVYMDYAFANTAELPEEVSVSFVMDDGSMYIAPIKIR